MMARAAPTFLAFLGNARMRLIPELVACGGYSIFPTCIGLPIKGEPVCHAHQFTHEFVHAGGIDNLLWIAAIDQLKRYQEQVCIIRRPISRSTNRKAAVSNIQIYQTVKVAT